MIGVFGALALASTASADTGTTYTTGTTTPLQVSLSSTPILPAVGPKRDVLCGNCGGGGGIQWYCADASGSSSDSYGNSVTVHYHWCYDLLGHTQQVYGYSDKVPCHAGPFYPCSLAYIDYDTDFTNGHRTEAHFNDNLHVLSSVAVGVCVDGYGNAWYC